MCDRVWPGRRDPSVPAESLDRPDLEESKVWPETWADPAARERQAPRASRAYRELRANRGFREAAVSRETTETVAERVSYLIRRQYR